MPEVPYNRLTVWGGCGACGRAGRSPRTRWIDPRRPFDPGSLTHWTFVDLDGWNAVVEDSVRDVVGWRPRRTGGSSATFDEGCRAPDAPAPAHPDGDRLVRLPEVKRRTGLSRSTIYRKIDAGRFPQQVPMSENIVGWREADVAGWIAAPS